MGTAYAARILPPAPPPPTRPPRPRPGLLPLPRYRSALKVPPPATLFPPGVAVAPLEKIGFRLIAAAGVGTATAGNVRPGLESKPGAGASGWVGLSASLYCDSVGTTCVIATLSSRRRSSAVVVASLAGVDSFCFLAGDASSDVFFSVTAPPLTGSTIVDESRLSPPVAFAGADAVFAAEVFSRVPEPATAEAISSMIGESARPEFASSMEVRVRGMSADARAGASKRVHRGDVTRRGEEAASRVNFARGGLGRGARRAECRARKAARRGSGDAERGGWCGAFRNQRCWMNSMSWMTFAIHIEFIQFTSVPCRLSCSRQCMPSPPDGRSGRSTGPTTVTS